VIIVEVGQTVEWATVFNPVWGETYFYVKWPPDPAVVALDYPAAPSPFFWADNAVFTFTGLAEGKTTFGFIWFNDATGLYSTCSADVYSIGPPPGACALPNGNCVETPFKDCLALGGTFLGGETLCAPCPGDLDGDFIVDAADLKILLAAYGTQDWGDLDFDGDTDQHDLGGLLAHYNCHTLDPPAHAGGAPAFPAPLRVSPPPLDPCVTGYDWTTLQSHDLLISAAFPALGLNFTSADIHAVLAPATAAGWRFFHHPAGDGLPPEPGEIAACPSIAVGTHMRVPGGTEGDRGGGVEPTVIINNREPLAFDFTWCDTSNADDAPGGAILRATLIATAPGVHETVRLAPAGLGAAGLIGSIDVAVTVAATEGELHLASFDLLASPWIPGDVDRDGDVDIFDLLSLLGAWGPCPADAGPCAADVDFSGAVDIFDLLLILGNWTA
jgi:hypothetical protein